ncbi:TetR-like C-terminal domain-containing protein [Streptacidiphilus sp. PAMC 29251]
MPEPEPTRRERYRRQTVAQIKAAAMGSSPAAQVRAVSHAYRHWALAQPHAYHLAYGTSYGTGAERADQRIALAAQRGMDVLLGVVAKAGRPPAAPIPAALHQQIRHWYDHGEQDGPPTWVLHFGLVWWSRLHGLISLELGRHLAATGIEPALLYRTEVEAMLAGLGGERRATA